ncbi:MAG: flavin reductase family protein [Nitratireductor sp.]
MHYDPRQGKPAELPHNPFTSLVVPRPIGWISTLSEAGINNLAPYSFFNALSSNPPFVMFAAHPLKDSQTNAERTGEFTVSMATYALREEMNETSRAYEADESEAEAVGLEMAPSVNVKPPRVAASPVALECLYTATVPLVTSQGQRTDASVVIGEVVGIHIDDSILVDGMVDLTLANPLSRLGYLNYGVIGETFRMKRPRGIR